MSRLAYLTGLAEGAAISAENSEFEQRHLQDVIRHMSTLARDKDLDPYLCQLIALGHDLGRTKFGVNGKGHAKAGAAWMKIYLKDSGLSSKAKRRVVKAISKHNQKHKIHGPLAEAIKDADTLAHFDEDILDNQSLYEQYRLLAYNSESTSIRTAAADQWQLQINALLDDLTETLASQQLLNESPDLWVHRLRILSRKLRSVLWGAKKSAAQTDIGYINAANRQLRKICNALSRPRLLHIVCMRIGEHHSCYAAYHSELLDCYASLSASDRLTIKLEEAKSALALVTWESLETYVLEQSVQEMLNNYLKDIDQKQIFKRNKLHDLRLSGKRLVYLSDLELVKVEPVTLINAVYALHKLIGKHRDLLEIEALLNEKACSKPRKSLEQAIKAEFFLIRKIKQNCGRTDYS